MKRAVFGVLVLGLSSLIDVSGQVLVSNDALTLPPVSGQAAFSLQPGDASPASSPNAAEFLTLPKMSADQAMASFQRRSANQSAELTSYSSVSIIDAELPDTSQHGEYELERTFKAPRTLLFKPIRFVGDRFVKVNIIARLLEAEVDRVKKNDVAQTAISAANYKLSYKGKTDIEGHLVYVFQVKPYMKRPGLFKGHIYLEARTGSLLRAEGRIVKSPSLFVKHIEFEQDYADFGSFTLPVHIHTEARAFYVGRMIIDVRHSNYEPLPAAVEANLIQSSGWPHEPSKRRLQTLSSGFTADANNDVSGNAGQGAGRSGGGSAGSGSARPLRPRASLNTQSAGLTQMSAKVIHLDHVLARYGPETKEVRDALRRFRQSPESGPRNAHNFSNYERLPRVRHLSPSRGSRACLPGGSAGRARA
jgi:hypothetical protein